jgi:hypothetical protein
MKKYKYHWTGYTLYSEVKKRTYNKVESGFEAAAFTLICGYRLETPASSLKDPPCKVLALILSLTFENWGIGQGRPSTHSTIISPTLRTTCWKRIEALPRLAKVKDQLCTGRLFEGPLTIEIPRDLRFNLKIPIHKVKMTRTQGSVRVERCEHLTKTLP